MKTRLSLFFAVLAAIAACQPAPSPKDETVELVNLGEDEYAFPVDGGEAIISFKSSNSWTVSCADDWVFVSQESGSAGYQDVEISVEPNQSAQLRTTLLCVSVDAEHSFNITVIQETSPVFSVSTDLLEIGPEGGRLTFGVNTNIEYEVSSISDWLTIEDSNPDDGVVELMVSAYEGSEDRTGGVRVKSAAGDDVFVKVVQELYLNDKVYGAEYYYYANYYTTKGVSWILNLLNEDFFDPYGHNPKIYTSGATNILRYPELAGDTTQMGELISNFEEKEALGSLVQETLSESGENGIQVYIGNEMPMNGMQNCSVVTATYDLGEGMKGTVGVIGPKRMDYDRVIGVMQEIMKQLDTLYKK